jgi:hypothetical protein
LQQVVSAEVVHVVPGGGQIGVGQRGGGVGIEVLTGV